MRELIIADARYELERNPDIAHLYYNQMGTLGYTFREWMDYVDHWSDIELAVYYKRLIMLCYRQR